MGLYITIDGDNSGWVLPVAERIGIVLGRDRSKVVTRAQNKNLDFKGIPIVGSIRELLDRYEYVLETESFLHTMAFNAHTKKRSLLQMWQFYRYVARVRLPDLAVVVIPPQGFEHVANDGDTLRNQFFQIAARFGDEVETLIVTETDILFPQREIGATERKILEKIAEFKQEATYGARTDVV